MTPLETPWGQPQSMTEIAPGIARYETMSHGGIHLTAERVAEMPKALRNFKTFAGGDGKGGKWFEEDCDWSLVAVSFPQFFPQDAVAAAHATMRSWQPALYEQVAGKHALKVMVEKEPKQRGSL